MPKTSKETASQVVDLGVMESRSEQFDGYIAEFTTFREDADGTPVFKGLPDDRCSCPHWGFVFKGKLTFTSGDRQEVFEAGDAFYVAPGHTPKAVAGSEFVQFSPSEELKEVDEAMAKNMQAMMQGA